MLSLILMKLTIAVTPEADPGVTRLTVLLTPIGEKWPWLGPPALSRWPLSLEF